jgi:hypothetical protein
MASTFWDTTLKELLKELKGGLLERSFLKLHKLTSIEETLKSLKDEKARFAAVYSDPEVWIGTVDVFDIIDYLLSYYHHEEQVCC